MTDSMTDDEYNPGGTAEINMIFNWVSSVDTDIGERQHYIRQCRLRLFQKFGAVLGGIEGCKHILWWKVSSQNVCRPIANRKPLVIRAGYMSKSRGLHWKRNNSQ